MRFALEVLADAESRMEGQLRKKLRESRIEVMCEGMQVPVDVLMSMESPFDRKCYSRPIGVGAYKRNKADMLDEYIPTK